MVLFCWKVIFYCEPKLRHFLFGLWFDLFSVLNDFSVVHVCNGFISFPWSHLWHWNLILTYSMPCLLFFHWCLQWCYFIVKLFWNLKKWDFSNILVVYAMLQPRLQVLKTSSDVGIKYKSPEWFFKTGTLIDTEYYTYITYIYTYINVIKITTN